MCRSPGWSDSYAPTGRLSLTTRQSPTRIGVTGCLRFPRVGFGWGGWDYGDYWGFCSGVGGLTRVFRTLRLSCVVVSLSVAGHTERRAEVMAYVRTEGGGRLVTAHPACRLVGTVVCGVSIQMASGARNVAF